MRCVWRRCAIVRSAACRRRGDEALPLEQLLLHAANHAAVKYDKQTASSYLPLESPDDDDIVIETGASAKTSTL